MNNPVANYLAGAPNGLDQNEADDADNIQYTGGNLEVISAYTKISQIQGNSLASMKITAYDMSSARQGQDFATHLGAAGGSTVAITAVRVFNASGTKVEDSAVSGTQDPNVTITITGGGFSNVSITFTGTGGATTGATLDATAATTQNIIDEINSQAGASIASLVGGKLTITGQDTTHDITIGGTNTSGLASATHTAAAAATQKDNPARAALITQYNGLLDQIDQLRGCVLRDSEARDARVLRPESLDVHHEVTPRGDAAGDARIEGAAGDVDATGVEDEDGAPPGRGRVGEARRGLARDAAVDGVPLVRVLQPHVERTVHDAAADVDVVVGAEMAAVELVEDAPRPLEAPPAT